MKMNTLAAALCATASLPVVAAMPAVPRADTFDDIQYWVGNGTNRCAVVIDFNDDKTVDIADFVAILEIMAKQ